MTLEELKVESELFYKKIKIEKDRLESINANLSDRTDFSDSYFLDYEDKLRSREIWDELDRKTRIAQGDPKERIKIKRQLRKQKIGFDQEATMDELKMLLDERQ